MAVHYLDLDALDRPVGKLKILDKEYDVYPLSVKSVFNLLHLEKIKAEEVDGNAYDMMIQSLQELVPACPREAMEQLKLPQLQALMSWAQEISQATMQKNSDILTRT